jgi:hypothetical protein
VFVAGFISGGSEDVDGNLETTRLLRSQLRTKSSLRVIDADSLPLQDVATEGRPARQAPPTQVKDEKDPRRLFEPVRQRRVLEAIGEEYQQPLIVTGTVLFTPHQRNSIVQREEEVLRLVRPPPRDPGAHLQERKGFVLSPKFIFIDGRTGTVMHSTTAREEILYNPTRRPRPCPRISS